MSRSKYHPHRKKIIEMHKAGKTAEEIARYINDEHPSVKATENSIRAYIYRCFEKGDAVINEIDSTVEPAQIKRLQDAIDHFAIINDELVEAVVILKADRKEKGIHLFIAGGWILTMLFAMFAGYYIGRCYSRPAFHYILTLTGIPAGIFIGLGIAAIIKKIKKKA